MEFEIMVSLAVGFWLAAVLLVVSLCRTAKAGDESMFAALRQERRRISAEPRFMGPDIKA